MLEPVRLAAGLGERQVAEFVEDDEVEPHEQIGDLALAASPCLGVEPVDEVDDGVEPATRALANATAGDRHRQMALAGAGTADQDDVTPLGEEAADRKIPDQHLVDRRLAELEVGQLLGRQLGDTELVGDRAGVLLGDLGFNKSLRT